MDMNVNENINKDKQIIIMFGSNDKILDMSLYDFLQIYSDYSFVVCNVNNLEFSKMKDQITNNGVLNERVNYKDDSYIRNRYLLVNDLKRKCIHFYCEGEDDVYLDRNLNINYNGNSIDVTEMFNNPGMIKVYTLENKDDILRSFVGVNDDVNNSVVKHSKYLVLNN